MLKQTRGFISGFITCVLLSVLIMNVFATPIEKVITAKYNNIKIYVDGNKIDPKDANGNTVEPFIYNGTTYLPVRAVGQAFGKSVEWDGKTSTVYIGKNPNTDTPSIWLEDMDYFNFQKQEYDTWKKWNIEKNKDSTGATHEHGILYDMFSPLSIAYKAGWQYTEYLLDSNYTRFKGNFSLEYGSRSVYSTVTLTILGDDKVLYTTTTTSGVLPQIIDVDITGVIKLKIKLETTGYDSSKFGGHYYVGITDAGFYE